MPYVTSIKHARTSQWHLLLHTDNNSACSNMSNHLTVPTHLAYVRRPPQQTGSANFCAPGENLWQGSGSGWTNSAEAAMAAVESWYAEEALYDYSNPVFTNEAGHFTALVWVATKQIGFGVARTSSGQWLVVANFDPPGNFRGQFAENVLQP